MEEARALIEKIIEEHKQIIRGVQTWEQVANDATALLEIEKAKENFMPGRFDQIEGLKKLEERREIIDKGLQAHFEREENALLATFEKHGGTMLVSALHSLLLEHDDIRKRLAHSKNHVAELMSGKLSRHVWEASAHDMRAHISHTLKLIEAHAKSEQELLLALKNRLDKERKVE